jgi:adenosylhomocysteine nucleosidase
VNRVAIIAAMEREILPFVRGWKRSLLASGGDALPFYENGDVIAVAGGIGGKRAERAALAMTERFNPETLVSAGLAGALIRSLKPGNVVVPSVIVDAENAAEYRCDPIENVVTGGVLVSTSEVAAAESKAKLVERFHGLVVDMEAAGVARAARDRGTRFCCVKAISDEFDFRIPPLTRFIDDHGNMQEAKFALWTAVRPHYWLPAMRLAGNSRRAIEAMTEWLQKNVPCKSAAVPVVTLKRADHTN